MHPSAQKEAPRPVIWVTPEQCRDYESGSDNDQDDASLKKRRKRQVLSCSECKRRKIKCDRNQPCGPCVKRGDNSKCEWVIVEKNGQDWVSRTEFVRLEDKVSRLETMFNNVVLGGSPDLSGSSDSSRSTPSGGRSPLSPGATSTRHSSVTPHKHSSEVRLPPLSDMVSFHRSPPTSPGSVQPAIPHPYIPSSRERGASTSSNGIPSHRHRETDRIPASHFYDEHRNRTHQVNWQ